MPRTPTSKLNIRTMGEDEDGGPYVLIEGGKPALEALAQIILDHAQGRNGCGLQLGPHGPGSIHFSRTSSHGLYLHLLPCDHPTNDSERLAGRKT